MRIATRPRPRGETEDVSAVRFRFAALPDFFALQDLFLTVYLVVASALVWRAGASETAESCARQLYACVTLVLLAGFLRGAHGVAPLLRRVGYRLAIAGVLLW